MCGESESEGGLDREEEAGGQSFARPWTTSAARVGSCGSLLGYWLAVRALGGLCLSFRRRDRISARCRGLEGICYPMRASSVSHPSLPVPIPGNVHAHSSELGATPDRARPRARVSPANSRGGFSRRAASPFPITQRVLSYSPGPSACPLRGSSLTSTPTSTFRATPPSSGVAPQCLASSPARPSKASQKNVSSSSTTNPAADGPSVLRYLSKCLPPTLLQHRRVTETAAELVLGQR